MWVHWGGKQLDALNAIVDKYNTTQGQTDKAKAVVEPIADAELLQKMTAAHIAGTAPDVFHSWVSVPDQVKNAMSSPLPNDDAAYVKEAFQPGAVDMVTREGKIWSYTTEFQSGGLVYRKSFFKEAGVQPPKTTVEMSALAKQLTKTDGGKITRYGVAQSTTAGNDAWPLLLGRFGGNYATFEGDKLVKLDLSSPAALEALTWWGSFVTDKSTTAGQLVMEDAWRNGLAAMGELDVYFPITELRDGGKKDVFDDLASVVGPSKPGVNPYSTCRGLFLHGERQSKVSDQRFRFMRWLVQKPDMPFTRFIVEVIGSQPAVKDYPTPIKGWPADFAEGYLKAASIATVAPRWKFFGNEEMGKVLRTMMESVLLGKATPKEALALADQTIQPIMKRTNP
jgi:multiple sugar transport system substrate-binding protein